jgi:hypothetical protein
MTPLLVGRIEVCTICARGSVQSVQQCTVERGIYGPGGCSLVATS